MNSDGLIPIFNSTHSTWSTEPVAIAILGMSPWFWFWGIRRLIAVLTQAVVFTTDCTRHLPETATIGILLPTGALKILKVPSTFVIAPTSGDPEGGAPTIGQLTPAENASTVSFGTYTVTLGSGSVPFGAYTTPLTDVVAFPVHAFCCRHSPVQGVCARAAPPSPSTSATISRTEKLRMVCLLDEPRKPATIRRSLH